MWGGHLWFLKHSHMCYAIEQCCEVVSALFSEMNAVSLREGQDSQWEAVGLGSQWAPWSFPKIFWSHPGSIFSMELDVRPFGQWPAGLIHPSDGLDVDSGLSLGREHEIWPGLG